jgi:hypothetical protein
MTSSTTPDFWAAYRALPQNVRELARKNYRLWQETLRIVRFIGNSSHLAFGPSESD